MVAPRRPNEEEVDQLLLNAQLRDELEPYLDESLQCVDTRAVPTPVENEFLASILAWERAPVMPISQWFDPPLNLPHPDELGEETLRQRLWRAIELLYSQRIVLDFTDHLTDRELYWIIYRDILPSQEKKVDLPQNTLHWNCAETEETEDSEDAWLRYYASDDERLTWSMETGRVAPPKEDPPFRRRMPRRQF